MHQHVDLWRVDVGSELLKLSLAVEDGGSMLNLLDVLIESRLGGGEVVEVCDDLDVIRMMKAGTCGELLRSHQLAELVVEILKILNGSHLVDVIMYFL